MEPAKAQLTLELSCSEAVSSDDVLCGFATKQEKRMHPYMVWEGSEPGEGAALVFAETARAAKKAGWDGVDWLTREDYTEFHVQRCREHVDYLMGLYDGTNRVIDNPPTCEVCEKWGAPLRANGDGCENCGGNGLPHNR